MNRKGLFTSEQEKFLAEALGSRMKPTNKLNGWLIKKGMKLAVTAIDNFGLDRVGSEWKVKLIPIVDAGIKGDVEEVRKYTTDLLNAKIDFKHLDDYQELIWFNSLTVFLAETVKCFVLNRQLNTL